MRNAVHHGETEDRAGNGKDRQPVALPRPPGQLSMIPGGEQGKDAVKGDRDEGGADQAEEGPDEGEDFLSDRSGLFRGNHQCTPYAVSAGSSLKQIPQSGRDREGPESASGPVGDAVVFIPPLEKENKV